MVCVSWGDFVQGREVNNSAGTPIMLGCDDQPSFDLIFPVERDLSGAVNGCRLGGLVSEQA